jgi:predicted dehydrogenase
MAMRFDRRGFLAASAWGAAQLITSHTARAKDVNGKLRLASVGTGGKGKDDLQSISASPRVEVVALCNVDESEPHLGWATEKFPKAHKFSDFRRLMDKASMFDAVSVSTPDHMHAPIALAALALGKHVFCQKPLAHTVHEIRLMRDAAERHGVVTQMGNQIQSHHAYRTAVKLVHDGAIGKVREVHSWQAGGMDWLRTATRPAGSDPVPKSLNWDLWLGVAPERPFKNDIYHPWSWRAWQDFSSGQLGDFGCHILDPVFMALDLTSPTTIEADAPPLNADTWAPHSKVEYQFPGTARTVGETVTVTWYDGPKHMPTPEQLGLDAKYDLPGAGSAFLGEKGTMILPHWSEPVLLPAEKFAGYKIPVLEDVDHYTSWAHACLDHGKTTSNFGYAGGLAEAVLLGAIAIRFPKEQLNWNTKAAQFTHHADANARLTKEYRKGWALT